jgi:hypothetical protein
VKGTWREGSPARDPDKYVEKALETGISLHRGPFWGNLEEGSSTRDLKMWMKGARWLKCLSLSLSLSEEAPWGPGGIFFTGDPGRCVKKVSGCRHPSLRGPLCRRGNPICEGDRIPRTLIDDCRKALVVGQLSARGSFKGTSHFKGALVGNLEGFVCRDLLGKKKSISGFLFWI